jgi:hypothetical protein
LVIWTNFEASIEREVLTVVCGQNKLHYIVLEGTTNCCKQVFPKTKLQKNLATKEIITWLGQHVHILVDGENRIKLE